jgi:hypothetical protein
MVPIVPVLGFNMLQVRGLGPRHDIAVRQICFEARIS